MPVVGNIERPRGKGTRKLYQDAVTVTGTADIDTGLSIVERAVASVEDAETTIPTHSASITGVSGGVVSVVVVEQGSAGNSIATASKTVALVAEGY